VWQDNADYCAELGMRCGENRFVSLIRSNTVHTPANASSKRDDLIWQNIKIHRESQPYIKENTKGRYQGLTEKPSGKKSRQAKQSSQARIYQLTAQDIRDYYMKLFGSVSAKRKGVAANISWEKVRPLDFITHLKQKVHLGHSLGASENQRGPAGGASEHLSSPSSGASEGRLNKRKFFFEIWTELIVHGRTEPDAEVFLNQKGVKLNPDGTFSLRYALPDGEIPLKFIAQSSDGVQQRHIQTRVEREKTISFPKILKEFNA
jgi:hypothetical protein